jgi:hypothetical protein
MTSNLDIISEDVRIPFSPERFSLERRPEKIGAITPNLMTKPLASCLDMLIKVPRGEVMLPPHYKESFVQDVITTALKFEDSLLPEWHDTLYVYLTVDQRVLTPGKTHRNAGWHFDGMQGNRYPVKLPACHQYVVSSQLPTEYSSQPVDASGLDENKHNWFIELGSQIKGDQQHHITAQPGDIMLMTAYQMHRSPIAPSGEAITRTFVRIDMSHKQQDRLGNTVNPLIDTPFSFHPRSLPEGLCYEVSDAGWTGGKQFSAE